jgi:hypothetical protein
MLDFCTLKKSALNMGYVDKWPSRMQGQFNFSKLELALIGCLTFQTLQSISFHFRKCSRAHLGVHPST